MKYLSKYNIFENVQQSKAFLQKKSIPENNIGYLFWFVKIHFDQFHFLHGPQDQTMEEALKLAYSTWCGIKPLTHMSSSKKLEDIKSKK